MLWRTTTLLVSLGLPRAIMCAPHSRRETSKEYIDHASDAAEVLNSHWYHAQRGLWEDLWWNSANALTSLINLAQVDGDYAHIVRGMVPEIFGAARASNHGTWSNDLTDDPAWWTLAWIKAYDFTQNTTYLDAAKGIYDDLASQFISTCGGQWWDKKHEHVNTINNVLFLAAAASLANRPHDNTHNYVKDAESQANWLISSPLHNQNNTFADGFNTDCSVSGSKATLYTYNHGPVIQGMVELSKATSNDKYLDYASEIADAAVATFVGSNGVVTEVSDPRPHTTDAEQFKGIFVRNLADLQRVRPKDSYFNAIMKSADSIWNNDRLPDGQIGSAWSGPPDNFGPASQSSALDCLVAAAVVSQ